ncbi:MAG: ATP-binding protein [Gammaproteobacteria bacterium]
MLNTLSLRYQINLRILLSIVVLLLFGGTSAIWQARHSVSEEMQSSVSLALQLIEISLSQTPATADYEPDWLSKITALKETRHLRIQMHSVQGQMQYFRQRNDQMSSAETAPQWFVDAVKVEYPQVEYLHVGADGKPVKIIIQADPLDEISEAWEETRAFFISIVLLVAMIFLAVNLVFNKALKSVAVIIDGLQGIENGDYETQLPAFSTQEFTTIAKAINHMSTALDGARRENSALALHSLEIQEEERRRLSQELHDEFGQSLTAIKVMAVTAKQRGADKEKIGAAITSICDHLFGVLRSMMCSLHPIMLDELGLSATVDDLAEQWQARHPQLQLSVQCGDGVDALDSKIAIQLFRVIQECLTNAVRHGQARHIRVSLNLAGAVIRLVIEDDGRGCDLQSVLGGFGLLGMRERVNNLGGKLRLNSRPGEGLRAEVSIPYADAARQRNS